MNKRGLRCDVGTPGFVLVVATRFLDRMAGFLVPRPEGCILLISPCNSIHTFGMRHDLDVAFLDKEGVVIRAENNVGPRKVIRCKGSIAVLERLSKGSSHAKRCWYEKGERVMIHV